MTTTPDDAPARRLDPEAEPPERLKRRVERDLRARGLLAARMPAWMSAVGAAAAALLLVAGGFWLGALSGGGLLGGGPEAGGRPVGAAEATADPETRYVLLLYEDEDFRPSADEAALVAEYRGWAIDLARQGALVGGEKLDETGTLLERPGGAGSDLPAGDPGSVLGTLGGYFVISAADRAEALAIAGTCPHLRHGGRIVVRPIVPT